MPRPRRIHAADVWYHVVCRGNRKGPIFLDDEDRFVFSDILLDVLIRDKIVCATYCLMDNHYHFLLSTPVVNISSAMQRLNGRYASCFNKKYNYKGHLFQGRFYSSIVDSDAYFLAIARYIELNPVTAGLVEAPDLWKWSGYRGLVGLEDATPFLSVEHIWQIFSTDSKIAQKAYKSYVLGKKHLYELGIKDQTKISLTNNAPKKMSSIPTLSQMFEGIKLKHVRDMKIILANIDFGYSCSDIAKHLALSPSTVVRIIKKYPEIIKMQNSGSDPQI